MHCVNLGVAQHAIANAMNLAVEEHAHVFLGPAVDVRLPIDADDDAVFYDLQLRFKVWLSRHNLQCRCPRFTSVIKGSEVFSCKAAAAPKLVAWLAELLLEFSDKCPGMSRQRISLAAVCLWGLAKYFHVLRSASRFLTSLEAVELDEAGHAFLTSYSILGWEVVPKFHQFQHIVLDAVADRSNPRFFTCFGDEDQVGKMLRTAAASHSQTVVPSTIGNYLMGLRIRWLIGEQAVDAGEWLIK